MKKLTILLSSLLLFTFMACATHTHKVGNGAQGDTVKKARQLWVIALVPINDVDTAEMAGDATDFTIETQVDFIDMIVQAFTSGIITSRSVKVKI
tara:strand:+ start:1178 stop:1462 length:285 start_codon:yes stop_codon:yes gene_type:complete